MKHYYLYLFWIIGCFTSCTEQDLVNNSWQDTTKDELVDLDFQLSNEVSTRAPLTEEEAKISYLYVFVVGNDDTILQEIHKPVRSAEDLHLVCSRLERSKFPVTLRVFANLNPGRHAFFLSNNVNGFFFREQEILDAATSGTAISRWGIIHMNDVNGPMYQNTDLPKIGSKRVELNEAFSSFSIQLTHVLAKVDIANQLNLQSLSVVPRVRYYPIQEGATAVPYDEVVRIKYPTDRLAVPALSVYLLPGKGKALIDKTGIDYTVQSGKAMSLLLPNTLQPHTRYARALSASGIAVSVNGVLNPTNGVILTQPSGTLSVKVDTDIPYTLTVKGDWLHESLSSVTSPAKVHIFTYTEQDLIGEAQLVVRDASGTFEQIIPVTYTPRDGETRLLLASTKSRPIYLVVVGDGFRPVDNKAGGVYDKKAKEVVDRFFSYAPFAQYKEYFSVYQVYANSKEEGADSDRSVDVNAGNLKNTVFDASFWSGGIQRLLVLNNQPKVKEYVGKVNIMAGNAPVIVLGIVNSQVYGGSGGVNAVTSCNGNAPLIAIHEIGHVFGLADEYQDAQYALLHNIQPWMADSQPNVDNKSDPSLVKWKHFIKLEGYPQSDAWVEEGGYYLAKGIWRSSFLSMMNSLGSNFNAISRETIVKKIMDWSGEKYSIEQFIMKDKNRSSTPTRTIGVPFDAAMMPVPLELYVKPDDLPSR